MKRRSRVVTSSQEQGPRFLQEDRYFHKPIGGRGFRGDLLAVMDGHGGPSVAEICKREIDLLFKLNKANEARQALRKVVADLNRKTESNHYVGSTLSIVLVLESMNIAWVSILGDSPVIILDEKGKLHTSPEHNIRSNLKEKAAVEKRGGVCEGGYVFTKDDYRFEQGLQMSRALGDSHLGKVISRRPEIYAVRDPRWILVASDGILDPSHFDSEKALAAIREYADKRATARDLISWVKAIGPRDNVTALVWAKRKKA